MRFEKDIIEKSLLSESYGPPRITHTDCKQTHRKFLGFVIYMLFLITQQGGKERKCSKNKNHFMNIIMPLLKNKCKHFCNWWNKHTYKEYEGIR